MSRRIVQAFLVAIIASNLFFGGGCSDHPGHVLEAVKQLEPAAKKRNQELKDLAIGAERKPGQPAAPSRPANP